MSENAQTTIKLKDGCLVGVDIKYTTVRRNINSAIEKAADAEAFVEVVDGDKRCYIAVSNIAYVSEG